ncbi:MAG: secretin and TonB N-terminal domain-containing protein [Candidatus Omnitrophica bacterium]|nr:secretin and TonB N-terminal domain-containing protein [Candidatus Omnitrophota bacterium]
MRKRIIIETFITGLFLAFLALFYVQDIPAQEAPDSQAVEYLEFRDVDIKDVLRQLAKQYRLNIVFSESVTGLVTVQLNNVDIQQALDSIITVNGFAYSKKDNVYKVTTPEEAEREGKMTKLFRLNNADAAKLKETLKNVLTAEGSIDADVRSNSIIVTDIPGVINKIDGMLPDLDNTTPQVLIEARLIETSLTNTEKLGIDWTTTMSVSGSSRSTTLPFDPGEESNWIKDVFPYASPTGTFALGTLDFTGLKAIFDFLKSRQDTKLIANPRIVTLNNQKAKINVGKAIPIATYERNDTSGRWEITGWESDKEIVGVNLEVTPQVSPDGYIRLKLKPEVSSIDRWIIVDDEEQRPITITRTAETEVQIKNGQTVVIGGLVKNKTTSTVNKVPILGDIPILRLFFSRREVSTAEDPDEQTDLLIFVTATIIKDTDDPLIAWERNLITSPPKPFKLRIRNNIEEE